jgi:group I intron endonuclease
MVEERLYCIYKHTSPSGKSYIGQTNDYDRRCREHQTRNSCPVFKKAINKYWWDNFTHEILEENLTLYESNIRESYWILKDNTLSPNGYNLQSGGKNCEFSDETKKKLCENHYDNSGENHPNFGKHPSEESCKLMSEASLGKPKSDEHKLHIREAKSGENHPLFGKFGEDNPLSKKYIVTHKDGHEEFIIGMKEFCRNNKLECTNMIKIAKGKVKTCKGFKCRYATEQEIIDNNI